jgi:hypothetical protein
MTKQLFDKKLRKHKDDPGISTANFVFFLLLKS